MMGVKLGLAPFVFAVLAGAAFIEVPEEARFPRDSADKHHVITAPYVLVDGRQTLLGDGLPRGLRGYITDVRRHMTTLSSVSKDV